MVRDVVKPIYSTFLSCEKDLELILKKLFIDNPQHAEILKRLLILNTKDCIDNTTSEAYKEIINNYTVSKLIEDGYIRIVPRIGMPEHEEKKSYIIISFDNFSPSLSAPTEFRDCIIHIDIICHTDCWNLGDYRLRPIKIAGYIDGLLNKTRLSGLGTLHFANCNELILDGELSGYSLTYAAVHGGEDKIEPDE